MAKYLKITAILLALFTLLIFSAELFKVRSAEMSQNPCVGSQDVNAQGKIIFLVSEDQLEEDLQKNFPCISQVKITKIYPQTLKIDVVTSGPVAKIADSPTSVTVDGKIIESQNQTQLPVIYLPIDVSRQNGQITDKNSLFAIKITTLLARTDFRPTAIRILGQEIVAYDDKETTAHFTSQKDANIQVDSLQQTVAAAKIDGDKIAKIDLRFDKPVITFK